MIHPCRWYHSLPSQNSNQIFQTVIKPFLINPVQSSKYSKSFQMNQRSGTFDVIDTCNVTNFFRIYINSKLLHESEARSIANQPDINSHITKIREEKIISPIVEIDIQSFSRKFSKSFDCDQYSNGATYVPPERSMILQNEITNRNIQSYY